MNKLLINGEEFNFNEKDLPALIHGEDRSGASLYTISLAARLYSEGHKLRFLCGFRYAEEEFLKQVKKSDTEAYFFTKEQVEDFKKLLSHESDNIVIIKNIELFQEDIFDLVHETKSLIISGDLNQCDFKKEILEKSFATKVFFSQLEGFAIPKLQKYKGFLTSKNVQGVTSLETI